MMRKKQGNLEECQDTPSGCLQLSALQNTHTHTHTHTNSAMTIWLPDKQDEETGLRHGYQLLCLHYAKVEEC